MAASIIWKSECKLLSTFRHLTLCTTRGLSPAGFSQVFNKVQTKNLATSSVNFIKKIEETTTDNVTIIEGINYDSDRKGNVIPLENSSGGCPLCKLNLNLQHTDVLILSQFVRPNGALLSRRVTGLCAIQQKTIECLVAQAKKAGLLINLNPPWCKGDPRRRYGWKKFNRYFEPGLDGNVAKEYK